MDTPEDENLLLGMTIAYLAGHTGDAADELERKLNGLTEEERKALIAFLSTPTHEAPKGQQ